MSYTAKNFLKIGLLPLLIYISNDLICRFFFDWYVRNGVDSYFHFGGGAAIAFVVINILKILEEEKTLSIKRKLIKAFFIVSMVALAAVLWETYEFFWDLTFGTHFQPSNFDTMKDLVLGLLGGTVTSTIFSLWPKAADGARERDAFADVLGTGHPAYDTLKPDTESRMRD